MITFTAQEAAEQSVNNAPEELEAVFDKIREAGQKGEWKISVKSSEISIDSRNALIYLGYELIPYDNAETVNYIIRWNHLKWKPLTQRT